MSIAAQHAAVPAYFSMIHYPATEKPVNAEPLVLLHGWGNDSGCWKKIVPVLQKKFSVISVDLPGFGASAANTEVYGVDTLCRELLAVLPPRFSLMGWSLGGMLAVALSALAPQRVTRLVTLASNVKFVADEHWSAAMAESVFTQFYASFLADAQTTLKRFCGLQAQGDLQERALLKNLRQQVPVLNAEQQASYQAALQLLQHIDNRQAFARLAVPGLHIFAEQDALVPAETAHRLQGVNQYQKVMLINNACHALPYVDEAESSEWLMQVIHFLTEKNTTQKQQQQLDKQKVAASFSRAASTYDSVAALQRSVGERLLRSLDDVIEIEAKPVVLDVGCGTGFFTDALQQRWQNADVIGLDIAEGMLQYAAQHRCRSHQWLCADAEQIPLADNSVDILFSSLAVQWCDQLPQVFAEWRRVLKPQGMMVLSTLGPGTLAELRSAWQMVDDYVHVNHFHHLLEVQQAMSEAGFGSVQWHKEIRVLRYQKLSELTRELKALGAHNMNAGQNSGLTGRNKAQQLVSAYEQFRSDAYLPATYEVFYGKFTAENSLGNL